VSRARGATSLRSPPLVLALASAVLAVTAWWFFARYLPDLRLREVDLWRGRLVAMAEDRRASIDHWLADGLADTRTLASYPTLLTTCCQTRADPRPSPASRGREGTSPSSSARPSPSTSSAPPSSSPRRGS
jgi:hypothetical protein